VERRLDMATVSRHFTGVALELTPNAEFRPERQRPRLKLSQLTGRVRGLWRALANIFAVAVVLELFAIVAPLFNQMVVDDAITSRDFDLLTVLALGFGLLLLDSSMVTILSPTSDFSRRWRTCCTSATTQGVPTCMVRIP
jgi:ATP-binding cassette subfamily B protein RaxB